LDTTPEPTPKFIYMVAAINIRCKSTSPSFLLWMVRQAVIDIHDFRGRLVAAERRLHNPLSERNREQIFEFERKLMSEGLSTVRIEKYVEDTLLAAVSMP
jgi:hypothetical protein